MRFAFPAMDDVVVQNANWVELAVPVAGEATVQFVSPGAQLGFKVSPGM